MRAIEHFKTITHHRHLVRQYCFRLGLYYQGLTHDLSKYSPSEFWRGVKYYQGDRSLRPHCRLQGLSGRQIYRRLGLRLLRKVARPYPHPSRDRRAHRQDAARTQGAGRGRGVRLCARSSARGKAMSDKMRKLSEDRLQSCIFQSKLFSL